MTHAGLDHLDDILGVDRVDGILAGPYDLALSLGQESVRDAAVVSAIVSVIDRARPAGPHHRGLRRNRALPGLVPAVDLLGVDTDAAALRAGLKQLFEPIRPDPEAGPGGTHEAAVLLWRTMRQRCCLPDEGRSATGKF